MASGQMGFGSPGKYDLTMEQEARVWVEQVIGEELVKGADPKQPLGQEKFHEALKDGLVLCRLINALQPGSVEKVSTEKRDFPMMENINKFLEACMKYGLQRTDLFQTTDLYERTDMTRVVIALHTLGKTARSKGFKGPMLGGKDRNPGFFTEEELRSGQTIDIMDFRGATQQDVGFGFS